MRGTTPCREWLKEWGNLQDRIVRMPNRHGVINLTMRSIIIYNYVIKKWVELVPTNNLEELEDIANEDRTRPIILQFSKGNP